MTKRFLVAGNWKMNASRAMVKEITSALNNASWDDASIAPPSPYLDMVRSSVKDSVVVASQTVHSEAKGAFTGEISVAFLKDLGISYSIIGHSERRELFGETDQIVASKVAFAVKNGLKVMACCGEKLADREANQTNAVVFRQLSALVAILKPEDWEFIVIAYEPVWAIGTGKVATPQQAEEVHRDIRRWLAENVSPSVASSTRILYGGFVSLTPGSVNAKNSVELSKEEDIDGFLIGGASLTSDFVTIIKNAA